MYWSVYIFFLHAVCVSQTSSARQSYIIIITLQDAMQRIIYAVLQYWINSLVSNQFVDEKSCYAMQVMLQLIHKANLVDPAHRIGSCQEKQNPKLRFHPYSFKMITLSWNIKPCKRSTQAILCVSPR